MRQGHDPVNAAQVRRDAISFGELSDLRLHAGRPLRPSTVKDYQYLLAADILPALGTAPADSITRQHIIDLLDKISERGSTRRADTARAVVSSVYSFGLDRGLVSDNPARGLKNRHDYQPRDVVLATDEIRALWHAINDGDAAMSESVREIVKLALLTGQRRAEISGLRHTDVTITGTRPTMIITRGRAKNTTPHSVPLSEPARKILAEAISKTPDGAFVFPGRPGQPILPGSVTRAFARTQQKLKTNGIRVHDIRRTVASLMAGYGIPADVRERILNHGGKRKGSVTESTYTWYDYDAEKRAALNLWAEALQCLIENRDGEIADYYSRLARLKAADKVRVF